MLRWFAPFPLPPDLQQRLKEAGSQPGTPGEHDIDLWIYDRPDRLLTLWRQHAPSLPPLEQLLKGYISLASRPADSRLISSWRLEQVDPSALRSWLMGSTPDPLKPAPAAAQQAPAIPPLEGQLVLRLLEEAPKLLDAYLDLELQAELAGQATDSDYFERLQTATTPEALIASWCELEASTKNSQQLQSERDGLAAERDALISQLKEAREESELTLLQLHQVQEELEHYFLISRDQANLLNRQSQLTQNAIRLASS